MRSVRGERNRLLREMLARVVRDEDWDRVGELSLAAALLRRIGVCGCNWVVTEQII